MNITIHKIANSIKHDRILRAIRLMCSYFAPEYRRCRVDRRLALPAASQAHRPNYKPPNAVLVDMTTAPLHSSVSHHHPFDDVGASHCRRRSSSASVVKHRDDPLAGRISLAGFVGRSHCVDRVNGWRSRRGWRRSPFFPSVRRFVGSVTLPEWIGHRLREPEPLPSRDMSDTHLATPRDPSRSALLGIRSNRWTDSIGAPKQTSIIKTIIYHIDLISNHRLPKINILEQIVSVTSFI